jgi:Xaa-Pro aminopeptidase
MLTMNTALLVGPYDWDETLLPRAEFDARVAAAGKMVAQRGHVGLVVHGAAEENGPLAYLTGFTPKLGSGFALVAPGKPIRIIVPGSSQMIESAKRLTWVEDLKPLRDVGKDIATWIGEVAPGGNGRASLGLWGGATMAGGMFGRISGALKDVATLEDTDIAMDSLRRRKSPRERELMRRAARALSAAVDAFTAARGDGKTTRAAGIAAERSAYAAGAQDARVMASFGAGGPPLPLDGSDEKKLDPCLAYFAVRFAGYWADGCVTLASTPNGAMAKTAEALAAVVAAVKPGISGNDLAGIAAAKLGSGYRRHTALPAGIGSSIGLSLVEAPDFNEDREARLEEGGVYALKVGASGEGADNALGSALVAIENGKTEVLWRSPA